MIAVIKSESQYDEVLARVEQLAARDPASESDEGRELEVLALLIKEYERRAFPLPGPSPLAAIRLRMDQGGLAPRDLVPFLGSRSKVSEVLAGKRPLSLAMIRALHTGLGIPLESLVSEETDAEPGERIEWDRFPVREMVRRQWIRVREPSKRIGFAEARELMEEFFRPLGGPSLALGVLHKTDHVRSARGTDRFALAAWAAYVRQSADAARLQTAFDRDEWGDGRLRELRGLSRYDVGPRLAVQFLRDRGVVVLIVPHLTRTHLDGAALLRGDGAPVIGLTLRHDRLDNFWFTLFHELMHVLWHLAPRRGTAEAESLYMDNDLDVATGTSELEQEADSKAREALVPIAAWNGSAVRYTIAPVTVSQLAQEIGVADAIVAGRVRYERKNYRLLSAMVGHGQVRSAFGDIAWPTDAA